MAARANVRERGSISVVDLSGLLMLGESTAMLRETVAELVDRHRKNILLNFREVTEIDSAGVGGLLAVYNAIKRREGHLKLLCPPQKVRDVLQVTQLSRVLEVFEDEDSALRSFD